MTTGQGISVRALNSLRECTHTLPFLLLQTDYDQKERHQFIKEAIAFMVDISMKYPSDPQKVREALEGFFVEHYEESFFDFKAQYEAGKKKDLEKMIRMFDYIQLQGWKIVSGRDSYTFPLNKKYRGVNIAEVRGTIDFILKKEDGGHIAVQVASGEPKYSYAARRAENRVENSLELSCIYLGLTRKYGAELETAVFYLKNKDDKGDVIIPQFEHRRGKNVISASFHNQKEAWECLAHAVQVVGTSGCDACRYQELCKLPAYHSSMGEKEELGNGSKEQAVKAEPTAQQKQVVIHKEGPLCVIAVPGAGKTFCLVQRLVHLIDRERVSPEQILCVTYTQKAAHEIKERVNHSLNSSREQPGIFTFHGLAYAILREHPEYLHRQIQLAGKMDRYRLIEEVLKEIPPIKGSSYDGLYGQFGLIAILDRKFQDIESKGLNLYQSEKMGETGLPDLLNAYQLYQSRYQKAGYLSFDDLVCMADQMLCEHLDILESYRKKYRYIMVDEFQDVSKDQAEFIYRIAAHGNLLVVGDDDQTIFGWRGGTNRYMMEFEQHWPGAQKIFMEDNFRSVDTVLHAADQVIQKNSNRFPKKIKPHLHADVRPIFMNHTDIDQLKIEIRKLLLQGYQPGDIAIISRKNKDLVQLQEKLSGDFEVLPTKQFLIEDAVFQVFRDILTMYYRGIGNLELYRCMKRLICGEDMPNPKSGESSYMEYLCHEEILIPMDWRDVSCLIEYRNRREESCFMDAGLRLISAFKEIQYAKSIRETLEKVLELIFHEREHIVIDALVDTAEQRGFETLYELLLHMEDMERYHDESEIEYPVRRTAINLLTAHKAKGKEYPVVIIYHVEEYGDTPEDRCLLYVAMTRAKKCLYLMQQPYTRAELLQDFIECVDVCERQTG